MKYLVVSVFAFFSAVAAADEYPMQVSRFFHLLQQGKSGEAIDSIYSTNQWISLESDSIVQIKGQLQNLSKLVGDYNGYILIDENSIKDRFVHVTYLALYDRQPVRVEFQFYRPTDTWKIYSFSFDTEFDKEVESETRKKIARGD